MDRFAERVGRQYHLFDYVGAPDADRVIVMMGSGVGAVEEAIERLSAEGERVGLVKVRLYRPFDAAALIEALPKTCAAHRRSGSHERAGRAGRTAISRRCRRTHGMLADEQCN